MTLAAYAHAGQHADCGQCDTWRCPSCREHLHELCLNEPCTCGDEIHDLPWGGVP